MKNSVQAKIGEMIGCIGIGWIEWIEWIEGIGNGRSMIAPTTAAPG